jgi:hypothetical protein
LKQLTLSAAYATWVKDENDNEWIVMDKDGNEIGRFPATWDERGCMRAIRLGREFELKAFNLGIVFGKDTTKKAYDPAVLRLNRRIKELETANLSLSTKLEKFMIEDGE